MAFGQMGENSVYLLPFVQCPCHILCAYQGIKIQYSSPINDNLEKMAKQLYDYWFVQFDFPDENGRPYKSSGREMVWNEKLKRKIPKDWYVKSIGDFANVRKGTTITKAQTQNGSIKVVAAATSFSFLHNEANRSEYVITISSSGANAGYINFWREPIFASDCSTVQGNFIEITLYCYYWLLYFQETLFNQQIGAAQPHVYPEHISKIPIVIPPNHILNKIKDCMVSINMQQHMVEQEIEELTKQRDELLPLLMNGQASLNYHLAHSFATISILYRHKLYDIENEKSSYTHRCGWNGTCFIQRPA